MKNRNTIRKHFIIILEVLDTGIRQEIVSSVSNNNTKIYIMPGTILSHERRELGTERLSNLLQVTQALSGKARI